MLDQRTIFEAIMEGFRKTTREATMGILVIIGIMGLMLLLPFFYKLIYRSRLRKEWLIEYNKYIRKWDLTINEIDLLEELSKYLADPFHKMLLIKNRNTFHKALSLWEKDSGRSSVYKDSLIKKLFIKEQVVMPEEFENLQKTGRPARFVSPDGSVYAGSMTKSKDDSLILNNIEKMKQKEKGSTGRVFVQDYRGINSYSVSGVKKIDKNSLQLNLAAKNSNKKRLILSDVYVIPSGGSPIKNNIRLLSKRVGVIENRDHMFKVGQSVKVAFKKESKEIYRVNGIVKSISLNKQYATLIFGYLKRSN